MAEPRCVLPNQTHMITRRCYQRTFRLRPSPKTNQIVDYALAFAAWKTGVLIHSICAMSNHLHEEVTDPNALLPVFLREFHRLIAKALNAYQGQWENLWAAEKANVLPLADDAAIVDRLAYIVTNPVAAGLVASPEEWPGVLHWKPGVIRVKRPDVYFDPNGECPDELELRIVRPPGPAWTEEEWTERVDKAIAARVAKAHEKMKREGRRFLGRQAVLASSFARRARSYERKREPIPKVAATEPRAKKLLEFVRKKFLVEYRDALREWCAGLRQVLFPHGTWWMARHHRALVALPPAAAG